ncbi:hypothetical protein, partial [Roseovarius sp. MMSF_3281]|uniref:hypothetical protein n=1 Tax=Roseovarius sp. MMSF_3281 TaxID=3046694 RepID=UPI00273DB9C8
ATALQIMLTNKRNVLDSPKAPLRHLFLFRLAEEPGPNLPEPNSSNSPLCGTKGPFRGLNSTASSDTDLSLIS